MLKKIAIALVVLILLAVIAVVVLFSFIDSLVKTAIEQGGTYAFETETTLESADLKMRAGSLDIVGLKVAQPGEYEGEHFFELGTGSVQAKQGGMGSDVIPFESLVLDGIDVMLVKTATGSNVEMILNSLKRFEDQGGGDGATPEPTDTGAGGQRVTFDEIIVRNIDVRVRVASGLPGVDQATSLDVPIEEVRLTDVGKDPDNPVDLSGVLPIVVKAVLTAVTEKAGVSLPGGLGDDIQAGLDQLASLSEVGAGMATQLSEEGQAAIDQITEDVGNAIDDATDAAAGAADDARRRIEEEAGRIGELLPGRGGGGG